ncbi:MAG: hypothetical protein JSW07_11325, partial [bacterium]
RKLFCNFVGKFLEQEYPKGNPYEWDVVDGKPPATTPKKPLLELRYLGVGQHVALEGTYKRIEEALTALRQSVQPVGDMASSPLEQAQGLKFSSDSNWLIGADLTLIDTVTIKAIFNDPDLYGIYIALDGAKAKNFAGLRFEILYRKVTEDIGVYSTELELPYKVRYMQLGAVSLTLPTIGIDIYTNGNFKIDLGFPVSFNDFSRSASAEMSIFIGKGGFYFAYLNGDTSNRVPRIVNGTFSPVIEFGIAIAVGVGRTFKAGPLSAGVEVSVRGMLEGCFAWFNPIDNSPEDMFYWIKGQVAVLGRLYGTIDFVIIKASIFLEIYAGVIIIIEAYKQIPLTLEARVRASISIKILFVRIHKSFSMTFRQKFVIGSDRPTPWKIDTNGKQQVTMASMGPQAPMKRIAVRAS